MSKLHLNQEKIEQARHYAMSIAGETQAFIDKYTTVTVERTVCRLLGIDGVNDIDVPYPNIVVDAILEEGNLGLGVSLYLASMVKKTQKSPNEIARMIEQKDIDIKTLD